MAYDATGLVFDYETIFYNYMTLGGVDLRKLNIGFEPGEQAASGTWEVRLSPRAPTPSVLRLGPQPPLYYHLPTSAPSGLHPHAPSVPSAPLHPEHTPCALCTCAGPREGQERDAVRQRPQHRWRHDLGRQPLAHDQPARRQALPADGRGAQCNSAADLCVGAAAQVH